MKENILNFCTITFFVFCLSFSNSMNYVDPGFSRFEYSYAQSILQPYSSNNKNVSSSSKCSVQEYMECFYKNYHQVGCNVDVFDNFVGNAHAFMRDVNNYHKKITPTFFGCVKQLFHENFNQMKEKERRYLWILEGIKDLREGEDEEKETDILYPRCRKIVKECIQCHPFIPYYIMEEIFANCSEEAFKKFEVETSIFKKPTKNELEKLSMEKIGIIATSKAVQNLTFNDLENMKFVAAKNPELENFLCNRETKFLSLDNPNPFHCWFTLEEYEGMKAFLEENNYFKWSFCSGVLAITSAKNIVCFPSKYRNCGDVLRNLPAKDNYESLKECRKIAKAEDFHHAVICN